MTRQQFLLILTGTLHETGGFTADLNTLTMPDSGYAVAISKDFERVIPLPCGHFTVYILQYVWDNLPMFFQEGVLLGAWIDGDELYLDLSVVFNTREIAEEYARAHNQKAYYGLAEKKTYYL